MADFMEDPKRAPVSSPAASTQFSGQVLNHDLLAASLLPEDSYTKEGIYWADLPWNARGTFINKQANAECLRELKVVGAMTVKDPLSPIGAYFSRYVSTGMVTSTFDVDSGSRS